MQTAHQSPNRPTFAVYDYANVGARYAEQPGQLHMSPPAASVKFSDGINFRLGKPRSAVPFSDGLAMLGNHVGRVVGGCPDEQMGRVAAGAIVALVTNHASRWDGVPRKQESGTIGADPLVINHYLTIPSRAERVSPRPAGIRPSAFVNLRPKAVGVRHLKQPTPKVAFEKSGIDLNLSPASALAISGRYIHTQSVSSEGYIYISEDI